MDLKPFTADPERLKCKITWKQNALSMTNSAVLLSNQMPESYAHAIKEELLNIRGHSSFGSPTVQTVDDDAENSDYSGIITSEMAEKMNSCDDCGLFDTPPDIQRHVKRGWFAERSHEPPTKRQKLKTQWKKLSRKTRVF